MIVDEDVFVAEALVEVGATTEIGVGIEDEAVIDETIFSGTDAGTGVGFDSTAGTVSTAGGQIKRKPRTTITAAPKSRSAYLKILLSIFFFLIERVGIDSDPSEDDQQPAEKDEESDRRR